MNPRDRLRRLEQAAANRGPQQSDGPPGVIIHPPGSGLAPEVLTWATRAERRLAREVAAMDSMILPPLGIDDEPTS